MQTSTIETGKCEVDLKFAKITLSEIIREIKPEEIDNHTFTVEERHKNDKNKKKSRKHNTKDINPDDSS